MVAGLSVIAPPLDAPSARFTCDGGRNPDAPAPTRRSRYLDLVATGHVGNNGETSDGRGVAEAGSETATEVRFAVFFFPTAGNGPATCQDVPPTRVRVPLDRPLGDRKLVDVGVHPAAVRAR